MKQVRPFGAWASPISAAQLAAGSVALSDLRVIDGRPYWLETRPGEGGRLVVRIADAKGVRTLTPDGFNVRTCVHEYGGAPFVVAAEGLWFSQYADQRLYLGDGAGPPTPMTPEGYRYADAVPAPGGGLIAVREDHTDPADVRNTLVRLSGRPGDAGEVLFADSDFVAHPRLSADGRLAWITWNHPDMPWDATRLHVARLTPAGLADVRVVAGGPGISVLQPEWSAEGELAWLSDESGFWNLYEEREGAVRAILPMAAEFGGPLWTLGRSTYARLGRRLVAAVREDRRERLLLIDPDAGAVETLDLPFASLSHLQALDERRFAAIAHSETAPSRIVVVDVETGAHEVLQRAEGLQLAVEDVARPERVSFAGADGRPTHALFYAPTSSAFEAPPGERPPLVVQAHGGPTSAASSAFSPAVQFWTSRGFAVIDVDYGGSTGYGRAYRERLRGRWGEVDVADVIAAATAMARAGRADPPRIVIHGASAGGFTVLAALASSDVFAAGASFYGVADLAVLAQEAHKFESRYMDGLVAPWPEGRAVYAARSPLNNLDGFSAPLLILQGADDPIVPPNQALLIRDALRARGVPVACLLFEGESHGWRRAETLVRAKEAELAFYGRVLGFTPADKLAPLEVEGWAVSA